MSETNSKQSNSATPSTRSEASSPVPPAKSSTSNSQSGAPAASGLSAILARAEIEDQVAENLPSDFEAKLTESVRAMRLEAEGISTAGAMNERLRGNLEREADQRREMQAAIEALRSRIASTIASLAEIDASLLREHIEQNLTEQHLKNALRALGEN